MKRERRITKGVKFLALVFLSGILVTSVIGTSQPPLYHFWEAANMAPTSPAEADYNGNHCSIYDSGSIQYVITTLRLAGAEKEIQLWKKSGSEFTKIDMIGPHNAVRNFSRLDTYHFACYFADRIEFYNAQPT